MSRSTPPSQPRAATATAWPRVTDNGRTRPPVLGAARRSSDSERSSPTTPPRGAAPSSPISPATVIGPASHCRCASAFKFTPAAIDRSPSLQAMWVAGSSASYPSLHGSFPLSLPPSLPPSHPLTPPPPRTPLVIASDFFLEFTRVFPVKALKNPMIRGKYPVPPGKNPVKISGFFPLHKDTTVGCMVATPMKRCVVQVGLDHGHIHEP